MQCIIETCQEACWSEENGSHVVTIVNNDGDSWYSVFQGSEEDCKSLVSSLNNAFGFLGVKLL